MLTISRPDVESTHLQHFDPTTRFIKLPIERYLSLVGLLDTINSPQRALINAVNNPKYRFICAALARRLGKTYIANIIAQLVFLIPNCNILIISPNYNLSSISFELQRKLIKHFDLEVTRDNAKDRIIEISNGSTIRMGSLSQVDSCVGRSYDLIIFDEAALGDGEAAFNVALRPTLDKPNSKCIFISTPRGRQNWFSRFFNRGFSSEYTEWCSIQATWHENPRMSPEDVAQAQRAMSLQEFEQEYCASFSVFEGQIYNYKSTNTQEYQYNTNHEIIAGCDPGYRDPTAFLMLAYKPEIDKFHCFYNYLEAGRTTQQHALAWQTVLQQYNCSTVFIDSAAAQFASDLAYMYDIPTVKARKDVLPGIAYTQTIIEQDRLLVDPSCTHVLDTLDQYRWDSKTTLIGERPQHDRFSHTADALRYALYSYSL